MISLENRTWFFPLDIKLYLYMVVFGMVINVKEVIVCLKQIKHTGLTKLIEILNETKSKKKIRDYRVESANNMGM